MFSAVVQDFVIDFIGKHNQTMMTCNLNNAFQHIIGVQSSGGIVRINDDDATRIGGNLAFDIG